MFNIVSVVFGVSQMHSDLLHPMGQTGQIKLLPQPRHHQHSSIPFWTENYSTIRANRMKMFRRMIHCDSINIFISKQCGFITSSWWKFITKKLWNLASTPISIHMEVSTTWFDYAYSQTIFSKIEIQICV